MTLTQPRPSLIICERHPHWAPLLRRQAHGRVDLTEARSLNQVWQELVIHPASAVLLQVDRANWFCAAEGVLQSREHDPRAIFLAAVTELPNEACWALRQIGVLHLLISPLDLPAGWRMIERHFQRLPQPALSLEERIWKNLPWSQSYLGPAESADQGGGS